MVFTPLPESHGREPVDEWRQVAKRLDKSHGRKAVITGFTKYAENDIEEMR